MRKVVRSLARLCLLALTSLFSFAIACAYGVFYTYSRAGRVIDAATRAGIPGIQVSCRNGGVAGSTATTAPDGSFELYFDVCESVVAEDIDGAANGSYQTATTTLPPDGNLEIRMTPTPTP